MVEIFSNLITPGVRYSAEAYDLANRRWYRLDVTEPDVPPDDWLTTTVADHVKAYHAAHDATLGWTTITMLSHDGPATFSTSPDEDVSRPIKKFLTYGAESTDRLPTTPVAELQNLVYISRSADRCVWRGQDCVFKWIEFDVDIRPITQEIRTREALRDAILASSPEITDLDNEMARQFCVVPILAVVIADRAPWKEGSVAGVLTPFCGQDLEMVVRDGEELPLGTGQLAEVVKGFKRLRECGVEHGDIKYWNTVLLKERLLLIDLGSVAPGYDGDAKALGTLLLWCVENARGLREDAGTKASVVAAAAALLAEEDFDATLACLSGE